MLYFVLIRTIFAKYSQLAWTQFVCEFTSERAGNSLHWHFKNYKQFLGDDPDHLFSDMTCTQYAGYTLFRQLIDIPRNLHGMTGKMTSRAYLTRSYSSNNVEPLSASTNNIGVTE